MVVPSSPGYFGVFHSIAISPLVKVFNADRGLATSYALVQHAILYLMPIVIGAVYLWYRRDTWEQVRLRAGGEAPVEERRAPDRLKQPPATLYGVPAPWI